MSLKKQPICFKFNCCAYKISEKDYNEFINTTQTKYNIKGYIEKSNCNDCKIEKEQIMKDNILYTKCLCIHNNDYNTCIDCEERSKIKNGYCKHSTYGIKYIVYCQLCEKERGLHFKELFIKNNNKYRCIHGNMPINPTRNYLIRKQSDFEYHEKCKFLVCKHDTLYSDECLSCKNELIINNKCKHNNKSDCQRCREYNQLNIKSICIHNIDIKKCFECNIVDICCHNEIYRGCSKCNIRQFCRHNKYYRSCRKCDGRDLCKNEWCDNRLNKKYNNYCLRCFIYMFPELPIVQNYKTKEKNVVDNIIKTYPNLSWIPDKKIDGGCSRRRPDLLLDAITYILIIEIDENKHSNYDCSCENKRLMEISQDLGHRPIVFIRFNPDDYIDSNGTKIKSCWKVNKLGIMCIPSNKSNEWNMRMQILMDQIQYWLDNPSQKTIEIIELFY